VTNYSRYNPIRHKIRSSWTEERCGLEAICALMSPERPRGNPSIGFRAIFFPIRKQGLLQK
jgi:hypothetical protein